MPAPSRSDTAITSSVAPSAPAPTKTATRVPAFSTAAARRSTASSGTTGEISTPMPEWVMPCWCEGSSIGACWRSFGTITTVTRRSAFAIRNARSMRWGTWAGTNAVST